MPSRNSWSVRDGVFLLIMVVCLIVACWYVARPRSTSTGAPAAQPPSAARTRFLTMRATTTTSPPTKEITPSPKEPKAGKPKDAQQAEPYELLRRSDFIRAPGAVRLGRANNTAEEEGPEARVARTSVSAPTTSSSTPPSSSEQPQGRTFSPGGGGGGFFGGGSGGFYWRRNSWIFL